MAAAVTVFTMVTAIISTGGAQTECEKSKIRMMEADQY